MSEAIAIDVVLSVLHLHQKNLTLLWLVNTKTSPFSQQGHMIQPKQIVQKLMRLKKIWRMASSVDPSLILYDIQCDGFELKIADAAGMYFEKCEERLNTKLQSFSFLSFFL